jgi:DNA-binding beta-propeller fold protein YncE
MGLSIRGTIELPDGRDSDFDHAAFDPKTRRVFVAHTARGRIEVIDHDASRHLATLDGFPEAAGVVAHDGNVLVTNRGAASLAWLDAATMRTKLTFSTAPRPNGVAITASGRIGIAACIGDGTHPPELHAFDLAHDPEKWRPVFGKDHAQIKESERDDDSKKSHPALASARQRTLKLPGRPRWCVVSADDARVFLAIRDPSMVLVARLPGLDEVEHWSLPSGGAHGMDIDHAGQRLYVACDDRALVEVDTRTGKSGRRWPLAGGPDATFFNPASGLVHVAIADPGCVETFDPRTGAAGRIDTAKGAKTTALVAPDRLYVLSPAHGGVLELAGA